MYRRLSFEVGGELRGPSDCDGERVGTQQDKKG
jgi:hypothetical protein